MVFSCQGTAFSAPSRLFCFGRRNAVGEWSMALETSSQPLQSIGNYDLLDKVAEGGMGSIYKGCHRETGQIVALKIMPTHIAGNAVLLKRFEQEFRAASCLDNPNSVLALDYGET